MASGRSGDFLKNLSTLFQAGTVGGLSDAQLLEQFSIRRDGGGEAAFRALVERHGPMVLRVCLSVLRDEHDAEDAFQVTFVVLARKARSIRKQDSLASWLHGVAHRVALKVRTAARRRRAHESKVAASPVSGEDVSDLSPMLHQEIERLPAKYRVPIVLCYLEGMTQDQAARELGWPIGTVRGRLARARDLLRTRLTRRGLTLSAGLAAAGSLPEMASAAVPAALLEATVKAALASTAAGILSRAVTILLEAVLKDMALARFIKLAAPLVMIAVVASGAVMVVYSGRMMLSGERTSLAKITPVRPPAPTDLAGDPLPDGALARLGTTRFLHAASPTQLAYAPDGATVASFDGALYLWDPATGRGRHRIETGSGRGTGPVPFAYAPDGRSIAVQAADVGDEIVKGRGRLHASWTKIFDPITGQELRRFEGEGSANHLAFSPDGKVVAGCIQSGPKAGINLWEAASGRVLRSMGGSFPGTMALVFSPDGNVLFSCVSWIRNERPNPRPQRAGARQPSLPEESSIQLWDVDTGKEIRRIGLGKTRINQAVLAPDGKTVATTATDKTIRLWDLHTGRELRRFGGSDVETGHIAFSPDGTKLASSESRGNNFDDIGQDISKVPPLTAPVHVWDTATGQEVRHWETDNGSLACFSPNGTTLATAGGQVIRLWEVASGREILPGSGHRQAIGDAAFAPDGRSIVTVGQDRTIRFWDPTTGKETRQLEASDSGLLFAAFSADGKTLATGYGFQPTRLWDVASGRERRRFQLPGKIDNTFVSSADLSPDGKTLATSVNDGVIFWDTATGERRADRVKSPIGPSLIKAIRFAPDAKSVATIGGDWIRIWDVATGKESRRIALPNKGPNTGFTTIGARLAYSPDGTIVAATSTRDGLIFLLDVASGRELGRIEGSEGHTKALAFSPDGKILATGVDIGPGLPGRELAIRLWDVAAGKEVGRVRAHRSSISALAFSPDGRRLVSASEDATALVWDVAELLGRGLEAGKDPDTLTRKH
jgi:RNA polymerase sigma factor (sigma-70 family)